MTIDSPRSLWRRPEGADLRVVVVGATRTGPARRIVDGLACAMRHGGHQIDELPWRGLVAGPRAVVDLDLLVLVEDSRAVVLGQLATISLLRRRPAVVLLASDRAAPSGSADTALRRRLFSTVDVVLTTSPEGSERARRLGATDTRVVPAPSGAVLEEDVVSSGWVSYVATLETIAARRAVQESDAEGEAAPTSAAPARHASLCVQVLPSLPARSSIRRRAATVRAAVRAHARDVLVSERRGLRLGFRDLPEWVRPTDVLSAHSEAVEVRAMARTLGLPFTTRQVAAWAALGALSAIMRVRDGDRRCSVIVDPSGPSSVFSRWARAIGYAPVAIDPEQLSDPASADVLIRLHPDGCTRVDIDSTLTQAARLLRRGGLLCVTVPVGGPDVRAALMPADLRALVARADGQGMVLVGDLDRDLAPMLSSLRRRIETDRPGAGRAHALVRLTFRRAS